MGYRGRHWSPRLPVRCSVCGWQAYRTAAVAGAPCPKGCIGASLGRATVRRVEVAPDLWKPVANPPSVPTGYRLFADVGGKACTELVRAGGGPWPPGDAAEFAVLLGVAAHEARRGGRTGVAFHGLLAEPVDPLLVGAMTAEPVRTVPLGEPVLRRRPGAVPR